MPILSIIIPVYNVENFLHEGINSVLNQKVKDIEIICIDDASTDNSLKILKEFAEKDSRFVIIECKNNNGVSKARNIGIQQAQGDYIAFFDPDDILMEDIYSNLINHIITNNVDIAMCGFKTFPDNKTIIPQFSTKPTSPLNFVKVNKQIHTRNDFCFPWRFLFKKTHIKKNKLKFNENIYIGSDTIFNFSSIMTANKIALIPEALYLYRTNNNNSIVKTKYKPKMEESLQLQIEEKKRLIKKHNIDQYTPFTKDMSEDIVKRYTLMLFNNLRNNPNELDKIKGISRILNMPMIKDAMKYVGFRNIFSSWKEYIFYLAMKFKLAHIVYKLYFK